MPIAFRDRQLTRDWVLPTIPATMCTVVLCADDSDTYTSLAVEVCRALRADEVSYVSEMAQRIAALLALGPALDANYAAVKAQTLAIGAARGPIG